MKAHKLAKKLLKSPNLDVWVHNEESPDYPIFIKGVEGNGTLFDADDDSGDGTKVLILDSGIDDGVLESGFDDEDDD